MQNRLRRRRHQAVRDPAALRRRNQRRVERAKARARAGAPRRFDRRYDVVRVARTRELIARARRNGVIGFVRFSYYEAFEDQLRPMEIDAGAARDAANAALDRRTRSAGLTPPQRPPATDSDGNRIPNCIFPSQHTITTGEYPLRRRILLYTSTTGLERREVRAFLAYTLRNAQALAIDSRLVPITDTLRAHQYRFVTGVSPAPAEQRRATGTATTTTPAGASTTATPAPSAGESSNPVPGVSSDASTSAKESP